MMHATKLNSMHTVLDIISESIREIHNADMNSSNHSTEVKNLSKNCYSEATRCINQLRHLIKAMEALGIVATYKIESLLDGIQKNVSYPTFISIDLGLRHRRNHYSGRLYFQAVLLHNDFFYGSGENDICATVDGKVTRIAEGGRYDDLVRQVSILMIRFILNFLILIRLKLRCPHALPVSPTRKNWKRE